MKLVSHEGSMKTMTDNLFNNLAVFTYHNFTAHWQSMQFKKCVETLRDDVVLSVMDFAENYTLQPLTEIQSEHWNNEQISILVHVTMMRVDGILDKSVHFYISDVRKHDSYFVQAALKKHHQWLMENGHKHLKIHVVWSDGCAAQFKSARAFYLNIARYYQTYRIRVQWNFFGSGHGKGEHDGQGAIEKWFLADE